jgi:hypothetical protein
LIRQRLEKRVVDKRAIKNDQPKLNCLRLKVSSKTDFYFRKFLGKMAAPFPQPTSFRKQD